MTSLTDMKCARPSKGENLSDAEVQEFLAQIPEWRLGEQNGTPQIARTYSFKNFSQALAFTVQVGLLAEKEDHHPAILTEWGRVTVTLWTHAIKDLHINDFILAAKADRLYP